MMRESVRFLKAYFIFAGFFSGLISYTHLPPAQENVVGFIVGLVSMGISIAWVYVGFFLRRLLITSPRMIMTLLVGQIAIFTLSLLVGLATGVQSNVGYIVVGLLINGYLLYNIKCLAAEEKSKKNQE